MNKEKLSNMQIKLTKYMGKIAGNRLLLTLRDTFIMAATPLMIAGFAIMISSVFLDPNGIVFGEAGINIGGIIFGSKNLWLESGFAQALQKLQSSLNLFINGTISINGLLIVVGFAYFGTKRFYPKNKEPLLTVFYSLSSFFIVLPWSVTSRSDVGEVTLDGIVNSNFIGQQGIFTGILVSGITLYLYNKLIEKNISIRMPDSVPPAVAKSFESLVPGAVTLSFFVVISSILSSFDTSLPQALLSLLQEPALWIASTPFFALIAITTQPLLQWFGIHGTSVWGPIFGLTWGINDNENIMGVAEHAYSTMYMNFSVVASGALTLAPIIAIFLFSKRADLRGVSKIGLAPAIFNISEPITFGLPIVLNPVLLIPYVLSWIVPFFLGIFLTHLGVLPIITNNVPWTIPPIISGFLYSGSIMGSLYQTLVIVLVVIIYMPFIRVMNSLNKRGV